MTAPTPDFVCPEAESHGNPFRYCGVPGCGWMEPVTAPTPGTPATTDVDQIADEMRAAYAVEQHDDQCRCDSWPTACASGYGPYTWDSGIFDFVAPLVAARVAAAWGEGYEAGVDDQRCAWGHETPNPYARAAAVAVPDTTHEGDPS